MTSAVQVSNRHGTVVTSWSEIDSFAQVVAAALPDCPGAVVICGRASVGLLVTIVAAWSRGRPVCIPAIGERRTGAVYPLADLSKAAWSAGGEAGNNAIVSVGDVEGLPSVALSVSDNGSLDSPAMEQEGAFTLEKREAAYRWPVGTDICVLQLTSGTTGPSKIIAVDGEMVRANHEAIVANMGLKSERVVSWLPLFHDMGLFGLFGLAARYSWPLSLLDSFLFARDPSLWLKTCEEFGATLTAAPPIGLRLSMTANYNDEVDLSSLNHIVSGADRLENAAISGFVRWASARGLRRGVVKGAYGLAEATLAVSIGGIDGQPVKRDVCSSGVPLPGVRVEIDGDDAVGEILVSGPSVHHLASQVDTAEDDGMWLRTGDVGEMDTDTGELWVFGRVDDLCIVGGVNVAPAHVEMILEREFPGMFHSIGVTSALVGDSTRLLVVAKLLDLTLRDEGLKKLVASCVLDHTGISPLVAFTGAEFPYTSSGKLRRSALPELVGLGVVPRSMEGQEAWI